jgi:uncharacterized protein YbaR (Trm112 family)
MKHKKNKSVILLSVLFMFPTVLYVQGQTARQQTIINVFGKLDLSNNMDENSIKWTDGDVFYIPHFYNPFDFEAQRRFDGDTIYLYGGNLHEGGFGVKVHLAADGKMTVAEGYVYQNRGDRLEYRVVDGVPLLIFSDARTGAAKYVFRKLDVSLRKKYSDDFCRYILAGKYRRSNGSIVVFAPDKQAVSGFKPAGETTFEFAEEHDTPIPVLVFGDKEAYRARKTLNGLELIPMKPDPQWEEEWVRDDAKPVIMLVKTAESWSDLPLEGKQGIRGRFILASDHVMTKEELKYYAGTPALQNLKIMRNEIFARHGYRFQTKEMTDYFGAKDWYIPLHNDVTAQLTEIESINIALIQILEKEYETWWDE